MTVTFIECTNSALFAPRLCTLFLVFEECARFCFLKKGENKDIMYLLRIPDVSCSLCCAKALLSVLIHSVSGACFSVCCCCIPFFLPFSLLTWPKNNQLNTFVQIQIQRIYRSGRPSENVFLVPFRKLLLWWKNDTSYKVMTFSPERCSQGILTDTLCPLNKEFFSIYLTFSTKILGNHVLIRCFTLTVFIVHLNFEWYSNTKNN